MLKKSFKLENEFKIRFIKCDITNEEEVKNMIERIRNEKGRLDLVINSAGIWAEVISSYKCPHKSSN